MKRRFLPIFLLLTLAFIHEAIAGKIVGKLESADGPMDAVDGPMVTAYEPTNGELRTMNASSKYLEMLQCICILY